MSQAVRHKLWMAVLLGAAAMLLVPVVAGAREGYAGYHGWIDRLTNEVLIAQDEAGNPGRGEFQPFLGQLQVVRTALLRHDKAAVYTGMNRFMDMLEAREGGIDPKAADFIFNYCYEVTPAKFHDVSRHIPTFDSMWWWNLLGHGEIGGG